MLKKKLKMSLLVLNVMLLSACGLKENQEDKPLENEWGLTLSVENVTPTGLKLIWSQSGVELEDELITGMSYDILEVYTEDEWVEVEELVTMSSLLVAIPIEMNETSFVDVDWEERYGELTSGTYRIGKEVEIISVDENVKDKEIMLYAEFEIE